MKTPRQDVAPQEEERNSSAPLSPVPWDRADDTPLLALSPGSPLRPPDHRWRIAIRLCDGKRTPRNWSDDWVRRARRFVQCLRSEKQGRRRRDRYLDALQEAHRLYSGTELMKRWEVEARLLAGEPLEQVAVKCDCEAH